MTVRGSRIETSAKEIVRSRREFAILSVFSLLFAAALTLGNRIVYSGSIVGDVRQNYIRDFVWTDAIVGLAAFIIAFAAMFALDVLMKSYGEVLVRPAAGASRKTARKYWGIGTAALLICWLPYLLSSLPGAVFADAYTSMYQALGLRWWNNLHPLLYSMLVKVLLAVGMAFGDINAGITVYTVTQTIVMAAILAYSLSWMYRRGVARIYILLAGVAYAVFPLFPFYAVTMWKDTPFSLALMVYTLFVMDMVLSKGESVRRFRGAFVYVVIAGFVICLRNNGLYIVIPSSLFLGVLFRKQLLNRLRVFLIGTLVLLTAALIVMYPVMDYFHLSAPFAETVGIPLQQVSRVVALEGSMNEEQEAFIGRMMPIEKIKELYAPCVSDRIKWSADFQSAYLSANKGEFLSTWLNMFWSNKRIYADAFLLETAGFWSPSFGGDTRPAYVQIGVWPTGQKEELGIVENDLLQKWFGFSFTELMKPAKPIAEGVFIWALLASFALALCRNRINGIAYVPGILLWASVMLAAPLAMSLRYVYIFVLLLPLLPVLPLLPGRRDTDHPR